MNTTLAEMLQCADLTVLERQRARLKCQQQQQQQQQMLQHSYFPEDRHSLPLLPDGPNLHSVPVELPPELSMIKELAKNESSILQNGWPRFSHFPVPNTLVGFLSAGLAETPATSSKPQEPDFSISRTSSCSLVVGDVPAVETAVGEEKVRNSVLPEKMVSPIQKESSKKRKAVKAPCLKANNVTEDTGDKRVKVDANECESIETDQNTTITTKNSNSKETSVDSSKENSKASEVQKPDYIHVRARRGQATDSHSLAERVRREKISERMKFLQDLVPGCNKITGKAGMLDEIINYVQSLQRQVEFLSMKLAAVNPRLDFNMDNFFAKEMLSGSSCSFSTLGVSPELTNSAFLQFNPIQQQVITCGGLEIAINPSEAALCRTSAPVSLPDTFMDSYFHTHGSSSNTWDINLQNLYNADYQHGRQSVFPSHPFTGNLDVNNMKMEM